MSGCLGHSIYCLNYKGFWSGSHSSGTGGLDFVSLAFCVCRIVWCFHHLHSDSGVGTDPSLSQNYDAFIPNTYMYCRLADISLHSSVKWGLHTYIDGFLYQSVNLKVHRVLFNVRDYKVNPLSLGYGV